MSKLVNRMLGLDAAARQSKERMQSSSTKDEHRAAYQDLKAARKELADTLADASPEEIDEFRDKR